MSFFCKSQIAGSLGFGGHTISVTAAPLCCYNMKTATDTWKWVGIAITQSNFIYKKGVGQICPTDYSLPTPHLVSWLYVFVCFIIPTYIYSYFMSFFYKPSKVILEVSGFMS